MFNACLAASRAASSDAKADLAGERGGVASVRVSYPQAVAVAAALPTDERGMVAERIPADGDDHRGRLGGRGGSHRHQPSHVQTEQELVA